MGSEERDKGNLESKRYLFNYDLVYEKMKWSGKKCVRHNCVYVFSLVIKQPGEGKELDSEDCVYGVQFYLPLP